MPTEESEAQVGGEGAANILPNRQLVPQPRLAMRQVEVNELDSIRIYEVMESDLDSLEAASGEEKTAIAFATLAGGVLIPLIPTWPVGETSATKIGLYAGTAFASGLALVYSVVVAILKRKRRKNIIERLRRSPIKGALAPALPPANTNTGTQG